MYARPLALYKARVAFVLIRVMSPNGKFDRVKPQLLNDLLEKQKVSGNRFRTETSQGSRLKRITANQPRQNQLVPER